MPDPLIYAGNHGHTHTITIRDEDDAVVDVSAATTKQVWFRDPAGNEHAETASFVTDGTDGQIRWTVTPDDNVDDVAGIWRRWGKVVFGDGSYVTTPELYEVYTPGEE